MQQGLNLGARSLKQRYKMVTLQVHFMCYEPDKHSLMPKQVYVEQLILAILLSISLTTLGKHNLKAIMRKLYSYGIMIFLIQYYDRFNFFSASLIAMTTLCMYTVR